MVWVLDKKILTPELNPKIVRHARARYAKEKIGDMIAKGTRKIIKKARKEKRRLFGFKKK